MNENCFSRPKLSHDFGSTEIEWVFNCHSFGGNLTIAGALTTSGAFASTFTMSGTTTVTFPTTGTLIGSASAAGGGLTGTYPNPTVASVPASALPNPTATTLGGIESLAAVGSKWINAISTSGVPSATQPAFTDISGSVAAAQMPALTGDVTTSAGAVATTLATNIVSNAKFRQSVALSVVGVTGNATANVADIVGVANQALRVNGAGTALAFGAIDLSQVAAATGVLQAASHPALTGDVTNTVGTLATTISANAITNAKMATMAAWTFKANNTAGAATPTDITIDGLTVKASPAAGDEIIIWDVAGTALKKATISSIASAGSVSSIAGNTGAFTLAGGVTNNVNAIQSQHAVNAQVGTSYAIVDGDRAKLITATNAAAQTYTIAQAGTGGSFAGGWFADIHNNSSTSAGIVTITATTSSFIIGNVSTSTLKVYPNQGYRLVSDGTNYQVISIDCGAGAWMLLNTLTASNSATLTDTTSITAQYTEYEIVIEQVLPATNNSALLIQFQVGGTFQSSSYLSSVLLGTGSVAQSVSTTNGISLSGGVPNTGSGTSGRFLLSNPAQTLTGKFMHGVFTYVSTTNITGTTAGCYNGGSGAITGIQALFSGGNLTSGLMKIYGRN